MIRPADFFGSNVKTVLNKPFFHAQDQKAYNVDGGTSIADTWTQRVLNTVIYNDIQGASLARNQVSLPAGTYYVEALYKYSDSVSASISIPGIFKDGVLAVRGLGGKAADSAQPGVSGVLVINTPGVIDLRYYSGSGQSSDGLGGSNNSGSIVDASIPSIYADLKIWQLDRSLEVAPKAINSGLQTIAGMNTEGGVMGADVTVSGNTLTITKGSCMSSDLTTPMAVTVDTPVVLPGTVNQDFYVFMVRLVAGGTFTYKAYTTLVGPSSDSLMDKWRLVTYAKNNGSGVTMPYRQVANRIDWMVGTNRPILTASLTASYVSYNMSAILPVNLFQDCILLAASPQTFNVSYDGTTDMNGASMGVISALMLSGLYLKYGSGNTAIHIESTTLRR